MYHNHLPFKPSVKPTAAAKAYHEFVRQQPCVVTGEYSNVTLHHPTAHIEGGRFTRSHWLVVPLVARLHLTQHGDGQSVEDIGHKAFYERHGVDLERAAGWMLVQFMETRP